MTAPTVATGSEDIGPTSLVDGTAGSHADVAERIEEYHQLGFGEFILSGHPHIEEAHWFAEGVMPILRRRGLLDGTAGEHDQQARTVAYAPLKAR